MTVGDGNGSPAAVDVVPMLAPSVSANHALVWRERGAIHVQDLNSRNGTFMELPAGRPVRTEAEDVVLHLAPRLATGSHVDEPAPIAWTGGDDFGAAIARAVESWLRDHKVAARATLARLDGGDVPSPLQVPLASGEVLTVVPLSTVESNWSAMFEDLWRWVARQNAAFQAEEETRNEGFILSAPAMLEAHREVVSAGRSQARTLLLMGPSGSGKERLAEVFHRQSGRAGSFVAVNCSMFSKDLLRSELFGAEAGSFTSATRRIVGAVERAQGGTLFLDEIGEIAAEVQPMLLRFLDQRAYESLGAYGRARQADVRVVAATNRDLRAQVRSGEFRADLWYRLAVHVVEVPPLRRRWPDVAAYLEAIRLPNGRHSLREALSPEALELLRQHPWEGNFRELANFAERLPRTGGPGSIDADACRHALARGAVRPTPATTASVAVGAREAPDWPALAGQAMRAFVEDHGEPPANWDDQKEWNEKYLKPLLFFHLSCAHVSGADTGGAAAFPARPDDATLARLASEAAKRVNADRGTAAKQLARYAERFLR